MQALSLVQSCSAVQACSAIQACNGITAIPPAVPAAAAFTNTYSVDFDGIDNYATIADADNLSFGDSSTDSPFSISAWIKNDVIGATQRIVTKATLSTNIEYMLAITGGNVLGLFLYDDTSGSSINTTISTSLSTGVWYHVCATYDGSGVNTGITLYVNGVAGTPTRGLNGFYTAMHNDGGDVHIGTLIYASQFFNGNIDEVAIIPSELSQAQVTAIYNSGVPADLTSYSPAGWWRMGDNDGGTGTTVTDQGSGGNDATLTNGPTFSANVPT
jgi:hypothetical protein